MGRKGPRPDEGRITSLLTIEIDPGQGLNSSSFCSFVILP
jgi:hypothetical protein